MPGNEVGDVGMGVEWSWRGSSGGEISCHSSREAAGPEQAEDAGIGAEVTMGRQRG